MSQIFSLSLFVFWHDLITYIWGLLSSCNNVEYWRSLTDLPNYRKNKFHNEGKLYGSKLRALTYFSKFEFEYVKVLEQESSYVQWNPMIFLINSLLNLQWTSLNVRIILLKILQIFKWQKCCESPHPLWK